ncbi:MAG: hypothetical protein FJX46_10765 [Alphaproteobacteria bacterium]|nr:hypothetical protein [Alphaproteobacteria bacterium]
MRRALASASALIAVALLPATSAWGQAQGCVKLKNVTTKSVPGHVMMGSQEWTTFRLNAGEERVICARGKELFPDNKVELVLKGGLGSKVFGCKVSVNESVDLVEVPTPDGKGTKPAARCR